MTEESLFHAALDKPHPEREAFLDQACGDNSELRRRVAALLSAYALGRKQSDLTSQDRVATGVYTPFPEPEEGTDGGDCSGEAPIDVRSGMAIGERYTLLERVGEGGMGEVWRAQQSQPVKREVAIKLIRPGMASRQVMARFDLERQALAIMDHPNIAKVLDGGIVSGGRPYFVMELVQGLPLTRFCDNNGLTVRERLELFVSVCEAVQHAHQKGIVHRDLKPSNILVTLVDEKPAPKVIDFGVAKALEGSLTEDSASTQYGAVIGTLEHMAPEQAGSAAQDVDTRADIYSLGVILYELLTGLRPFDDGLFANASLDEILRIIRQEEPFRPSARLSRTDGMDAIAGRRGLEPKKLIALLRGELDWIVMKCLEKERDRRYATANGLKRDVQRYLADEPVEACPPSALYRLRKFARKHRAALATTMAFMLLLVGGIVLTTWLAVRATRAERLAGDRLTHVQQALAESDRSRRQAEAVSGFLAEAFRKPDPFRAGRQVTIAEMLHDARAKLEVTFADQPAVRAILLDSLGQTYLGLGLERDAVELLSKAHDLYQRFYGSNDRRGLRAMGSLSWALFLNGDFDRAIALGQEALKRSRSQWKPEEGNSPVPTMLSNLAAMYVYTFQLGKALPLNEEAVRLTRATKGEEHADTGIAMIGLARIYNNTGRHDRALEVAQKAEAILTKGLGPDHAHTILARNFHAQAFGDLHKWKNGKAVAMLEELRGRVLERFGHDHPQASLFILSELSRGYLQTRQYEKAIGVIEPALADLEKSSDRKNHFDTVYGLVRLSSVYAYHGNFPKAITWSKDAFERAKLRYGSPHPVLSAAARILVRSYPFDAKAIPLNRATLEILEEQLGTDHEATYFCTMNLAQGYGGTDRHREAEPVLQKAVERARKHNPPHSGALVAAISWLADNQRYQGKYAEAEGYYREMVKAREQTMPDSWLLHNAGSLLGECLSKQKKFERAEVWLLNGYNGLKKKSGEGAARAPRPRLVQAIDRLIDHYKAIQNAEEVKRWEAEKATLRAEP